MIYLGDRDAVTKLAACGFLPLLPELLGVDEGQADVRYLRSLQAQVKRSAKKQKGSEKQRQLEEFCAQHTIIEGASDPARLQELLLGGMDPGDALLFAEAESTGGTVVTGDKRAITAYARLSTPDQRRRIRVSCWEQLLLRVHRLRGFDELRQGCCGALDSDGMLGLAFSSGMTTGEDHALACLHSYLNQVTQHSADVLVELEIAPYEPA